MTGRNGSEASATHLAIHTGEYASTRVALVDPTENVDEEDGLGGEHRDIVREPPRYFRDDAGADLPVPHHATIEAHVEHYVRYEICDQE